MDSQKNENPRKKKVSQKKKKGRGKKITKRILIGLLIFIICAAAGVTGGVFAIIQSAPSLPTGDLLDELTQSSQLYDSEGNYIEDLSYSDNRQILLISDMPENLKNAYISIEDQRYKTHPGIDIKRIFGALLVNIKTRSSAQGGSTITQQLVKNMLLTQEKSYKRKIQEMYLAIQLEKKYDKDQILEAYLNTIWVGGVNYGVESGSLFYFGKSAKDLNLAECALLAGINPNASLYDPYNTNKIIGMKKRLSEMLEAETITQEEYDSSVSTVSSIFNNLADTGDIEAFNSDLASIIDFMKSKDPILLNGSTSEKASRESYYNNLPRLTYKERQVITLDKMLELGKITQEEYDEAVNYKLVLQNKEDATQATKYQWFIEPAVDQITADYAKKYDVDISEANRIIRTGGYSITLTLNTKIQDAAESAINDSSYYPRGYEDYALNENDEPLSQPQGASVVMETSTGKVVAVVGGRGEQPERSYNRATDTAVARQLGSCIKPLAVYTPAIERQIATAATVIEDSPLTEEQVKANKGWDPRNYDDTYYRGYVTVRDAVRLSLNTVAVKLQMQVGASTSVDYLTNKFHVSTIVTSGSVNDKNSASLALGGLTRGVTPLEMAAAYATLGNSGVYSEPIFYTQIVDKYGNTVLERKSEQSQEISEQAAYIMTDMLETVVKSGTGTRASLGSQPAAGKTGTTDDHTNGWFIGYTPYYTCSVWIGHDNKSVSISGLVGGTGAPIWKSIMKTAHEDLEIKQFNEPSGITTAKACLDSGDAPSDLCSNDPRGSRVHSEIFIKGTEPVKLCNVHVEADIDSSTGMLATEFCPKELLIKKIFITRSIPSRVKLADDAYVLPADKCTTHLQTVTPSITPSPSVTPSPTPGDGNTGNEDNPPDIQPSIGDTSPVEPSITPSDTH